MPESKSRKQTPVAPKVSKSKKPVKLGSPPWVAPVMVGCFVLGLLWIVAYYIAPDAPLLKDLTYWNVVIGFGLIGVGFVISTKWK
ncbi:MAG: cell division protein CrgA [Candidatus Nanopelagicales bacterium]|nr:cell division protein CrgA [Candidatus Nanopelagicales bacterium]